MKKVSFCHCEFHIGISFNLFINFETKKMQNKDSRGVYRFSWPFYSLLMN